LKEKEEKEEEEEEEEDIYILLSISNLPLFFYHMYMHHCISALK